MSCPTRIFSSNEGRLFRARDVRSLEDSSSCTVEESKMSYDKDQRAAIGMTKRFATLTTLQSESSVEHVPETIRLLACLGQTRLS
mmetsp:Transcript_69139/g.114939  ORF Transcript_69139/g.114939 Transcript_69139/m.114939 type:complete len:85 (+) Transcript_69139:82-336(+)